MKHAALYMRSSKDKAELGLDIQRKELRAFAKANGLHVAAEYADMEVSGSLDELSRPGLNNLLAALRDTERKWDTVLAVDTSRIARDHLLALRIQHDCNKAGVSIRYSKLPVSGNGASDEMVLGMFRLNDQYLSRISAEKGRAGQEANIARGWRAGGAAPLGYRLKHHETGAVRGGAPVRKSTLVIDRVASRKVAKFLKARADGTPRHVAAADAGLGDRAVASLIGIERNALTYAGYTVWNARRKINPTKEDTRKTMVWKPRGERVESPKPTHEAVITRAQAERILAAVDVHSPRRYTLKKPGEFLLTGLLFTPDDKPWQGEGGYYRVKREGRGGNRQSTSPRVKRAAVDALVLRAMGAELRGDELAARAVDEARRLAAGIQDDPRVLDERLRRIAASIDKLTDVVAETGNRSLVEKLEKLERERDVLKVQRAECAEKAKLKHDLLSLTPHDVTGLLGFHWPADLEGEPAARIVDGPTAREDFGGRRRKGKLRVEVDPDWQPDIPEVRRTLGALVQRIVLDPTSRKVRIKYRVRLVGHSLATPRGFEPRLPP